VKIEIDMSELTALGRQLVQDAPRQARAAARSATQREGRAVKSRARAGAPRETGWLASQGIRMKSFNNPDNVATNIFTVPNPKGRDVGFYQEYGTSRNPPVGFMQAAIAPAEQSYPPAVLAAIDPFGAPGSDGGGGDE
jgi:hypothetical protein